MPYITKENREKVDWKINDLIDVVRGQLGYQDTGGANYVITRTILNIMKPPTGWSYDSLSDVVKTLESVKAEVQRRLLGPYEDKCINKNGDLKEFEEGH